MNKLKVKEATTLKNKINAMTEQADRSTREYQRSLQKKDLEQVANLKKF